VSTTFLTRDQAEAYGRCPAEPPDREVLKRFFFLDDVDRELAAKRRGDRSRLLGFASQLVTVRQVRYSQPKAASSDKSLSNRHSQDFPLDRYLTGSDSTPAPVTAEQT
jgi:hypothetical protein